MPPETPGLAADPSGDEPDRASQLCLSCGLCCNGGLYNHVKLDEEDRQRLSAAGADAPEVLLHPCRYFAAGPCAVYAVRPAACQSYRCEVLKSFMSGAIDFATARSRVDEAVALRARMTGAAPDGTNPHDLAREWVASAPGGRGPERAKAILAYVAYWTFAERYFLKKNDTRVSRVKV